MARVLTVHPENPQLRLIRQAVDSLQQGNIIVYPTDSSYAFACLIGNKEAMKKISLVRQLKKNHNFTLVCRDLSDIAIYAKVDKQDYRLLKSLTPGSYTFILKATHEVPRRLQNPKRKTIGIRVPDNVVSQCLLTELGQPLMSSTLMMPNESLPMNNMDEIYRRLNTFVDIFIDSGEYGLELTTVIDLSESQAPKLLRQGKGEAEFLVN